MGEREWASERERESKRAREQARERESERESVRARDRERQKERRERLRTCERHLEVCIVTRPHCSFSQEGNSPQQGIPVFTPLDAKMMR